MLLINFNLFAQGDPWCASDPVTVELNPQGFAPGDPTLYTPKVYNMTFWAVYKADGSSDYAVQEGHCLEVIANMNREFNRYNIFFKYRGVNYLYNDSLYFLDGNCQDVEIDDPNFPGGTILVPKCDEDGDGDCYEINEMNTFAGQPGNFDPNSLNTYIYYDSCGFSGYWSTTNNGRNVYVRSSRFNDYHTAHELGHMFGLAHTWRGSEPYDPETPNQTCEHVERSVGHPDFNANEQGDLVIDTAAMTRFSKTPGNVNYVDPNTCSYEGFDTDCEGTDFIIPNNSEGTLNFMNDGTECPTTSYSQTNDDEGFTLQQGLKMRLKIASTPTRFGPAETTLESLYEPYKGAYNTVNIPHFQPGFSYNFIDCDGDYPDPAPYGDTFLFNQNIVLHSVNRYEGEVNNTYSINHPNHSSIVIAEVNTAYNGFQTEKCWDRDGIKSSSGSITKFNDNTFNNNVTITQKDSTQINDANLIPSLPNGLYKIEKHLLDGTVEESIIQKGNN